MATIFACCTLVVILGVRSDFASARPPAARARVAHRSTTTATYSILIGPIAASHGFRVQLEITDCGAKTGGMLVDYEKGNQVAALDHSYQGPAPECRISSNLGTTILKVKWGTALNFDLRFTATTKLDLDKVNSSCGTAFFASRTARSTGNAVLAIHPGALGRVHFSKVTAHLLGEGSTGCDTGGEGTLPINSGSSAWFGHSATRAVGEAMRSASLRASAQSAATGGDAAGSGGSPSSGEGSGTPGSSANGSSSGAGSNTGTTASVTLPTITADGSGSQFISSFNTARSLTISASSLSPYNPLTIINDEQPDSPAKGVSGSMAVALSTPVAFTVNTGDSTAQIDAAASFARGILSFTATRDCGTSTGALDGTLMGSIVVRDPIFGTVTYNGSSAVDAAVGNADASLSTC